MQSQKIESRVFALKRTHELPASTPDDHLGIGKGVNADKIGFGVSQPYSISLTAGTGVSAGTMESGKMKTPRAAIRQLLMSHVLGTCWDRSQLTAAS